MAALSAKIASVRMAFGRLTQQEQFMVVGVASAVVLVILVGVGWAVSSAIDRAEHRVKVKTEQLAEVLQLQGEYKTRLAEKDAKLRQLGRSKVRLVSLVEDIARQAGVEIGQLKPQDSEASEGIVESRVDLRVSKLSADRLQDFLERLEKAPGVVVVRRLNMNKPYRRDSINIELTVTTYKRKESKGS